MHDKRTCSTCGRSVKKGSRPYDHLCFSCLKTNHPELAPIVDEILSVLLDRTRVRIAWKKIAKENDQYDEKILNILRTVVGDESQCK